MKPERNYFKLGDNVILLKSPDERSKDLVNRCGIIALISNETKTIKEFMIINFKEKPSTRSVLVFEDQYNFIGKSHKQENYNKEVL